MAGNKEPRLVRVDWEDAYSDDKWMRDEELDREFVAGGCRCITVGYLIRETKQSIVVAARTGPNFVAWGLVQAIPRGMVRRIRTVK